MAGRASDGIGPWDFGGWMRVFTPVLAVIGSRRERRNWVALKSYMESDRG